MYPTTSPSRSASTHWSGEPPARFPGGSSSPCSSHPGARTSIPGRPATCRAYTSSQTFSASRGSARRSTTSSVPSGTVSRTCAVSISALSLIVAIPYPNRP